MKALHTLATKELKDGLRNRWIHAITLLLTLFALSLSTLGSAPVGEVKTSALSIIIVSLASLNIFLIPLIALLLGFDSIVGEKERGTLPLLLVHPIKPWQIIIGKYLGQLTSLSIATLIAYTTTAIAIVLTHKHTGNWTPYLKMTLTTIALGGSFLAIGNLLSTLAKERAQAAGMAIGAWLIFVLIYDIALLSALLLDKKHLLTEKHLSWLLWANPADAYRLLNIGSGENATVAGMLNVGQSVALSPSLLTISLVIWITLPLLLTVWLFKRQTP